MEANRRFLLEMEMERERLFVDEEDAPEFHHTGNDHKVGGFGKDVINISDDE